MRLHSFGLLGDEDGRSLGETDKAETTDGGAAVHIGNAAALVEAPADSDDSKLTAASRQPAPLGHMGDGEEAALGAVSCSVSGLGHPLSPLITSGWALALMCSFPTSSFSPCSTMLVRSSELACCRRRCTDWVGEGVSKAVGKSHESIVPCKRSEGCLRRSRRRAKGGRSPAGKRIRGSCAERKGRLHTEYGTHEVGMFLCVLEKGRFEELRGCRPAQLSCQCLETTGRTQTGGTDLSRGNAPRFP
jgi:hypothetical protein